MSPVQLILICGLPGVGKSTLAGKLAQKLKYSLFSVDPIESAIIESGMTKNFTTGLAAYIVARNLADEQLKLGNSVIIDAVNSVKEARNIWHTLSNKHQCQLLIIECILDQYIHKKRIESRIRNLYGFSEITWDEVEVRRKEYLEWHEERLILDFQEDIDTNFHKALNYIQNKDLHGHK